MHRELASVPKSAVGEMLLLGVERRDREACTWGKVTAESARGELTSAGMWALGETSQQRVHEGN